MSSEYPPFTVNDTEGGWVEFPSGYRWLKGDDGDLVVYPLNQYSIQVYDRPITIPTGMQETARFRDGRWSSVVCHLQTGD